MLEAHRLHQRTMFDLEMIKEIGYCHGIENYSRHLTGRGAGRAAADAARLPAARRADDRRREPPDGAAGPRDVSRRPVAQGSARRLRVPAAVGARQPAAELRGMGGARRPAGVRLGDARALRAAPRRRRRRRADHPADRAGRSADRRAARARPGRRPARPRSATARRGASGCWSRR